jgi:hypothetical protein
MKKLRAHARNKPLVTWRIFRASFALEIFSVFSVSPW